METIIRKERSGYTATTTCKLEGTPFNFKLSTFKTFNGQLVTTATCFKKDGLFESHRLYQDFSIRCAKENVRVTEKAVTNQHNEIKQNISNIMDAAREHYSSPTYLARYGKDEEVIKESKVMVM